MRRITHIIWHRSEEGFTGAEVNAAEAPNSYHGIYKISTCCHPHVFDAIRGRVVPI